MTRDQRNRFWEEGFEIARKHLRHNPLNRYALGEEVITEREGEIFLAMYEHLAGLSYASRKRIIGRCVQELERMAHHVDPETGDWPEEVKVDMDSEVNPVPW